MVRHCTIYYAIIIFFNCLGSSPYYGNQYGIGKLNILTGNIECFGQETSLIQCSRIDHGKRKCNEVAGVLCKGKY